MYQFQSPYQNYITPMQDTLQSLQQAPTFNQSVGQSIQYVNGIESAKAYRLSPNSSIVLWDSNDPKFYIKTSDASGFCTIKQFKFEEIKNETSDSVEKIQISEFEALKADVEKIKEDLYESNNANAK